MAVRKHANNNPNADMYDRTLSRDEYMNARWISEPLCLFDNCLETDGALACVIVRADRARDCHQPPVSSTPASQGFDPQHQTMTNYYCEDPLLGPSWATAARLWSLSRHQAADIEVAQIYDAFSPLIPLSLEGYGFCERGEGAAFTENGAIEIGGRLPVNTSGGGMSEAYVHGFNLINEGVRQMRGTSTNQVDGADSCLVTSGEGVPTGALVLRKYVRKHEEAAMAGDETMVQDWPLPDTVEDEDAPFWQHANAGDLAIQACSGCSRLRHPARPMCPFCQSREARVADAVGTGTGVVAHHPPPAIAAGVHAVRALQRDRRRVDEDPTIRLVGNLVSGPDGRIDELDPHAITIGEAVSAVFSKMADDCSLVRWVRAV